MKVCAKCRKLQQEEKFSSCDENEDGLYKICKKCLRYDKQYHLANKEKIKERKKQYHLANKEKIKERKKQYRLDNKEKIKERAKQYYLANKEKIRKYQALLRKESVQYRLSYNLRRRLRAAIKNNSKIGSAVRDLGCSINQLKKHLEKQFYSHPITNEKMTWDNWTFYGWHIDHIKPLSSFDLSDRKQFLEACHYTNLQPLWAEENLSKGNLYEEEN